METIMFRRGVSAVLSSFDGLEKHYDERTAGERRGQRRGHLDEP
jgi:hypothetical protein